MSSLTLFSRCPMPSGRSERASVITFSVLARKSESGAVSCSVLAGFGFLSYTAFEVLERNLLVSSGPQEHRPYILQQCARVESDHFLRALSAVVNKLASGTAPAFLRPFLGGGVSIALSKSSGGVRPLACGDPFR